ncbi:MAG TPA: glycosyltransferase [Mucilaginibacter sp.]
MKCLQIVPAYKPAYVYGGPIYSVSALCEELIKAGHQVTVITTTANGKSELEVTPGKMYCVDGVDVLYFKRYTKDHTHFSPGLLGYLWKNINDYDVVHIHSWWNLISLIAVIICAIKSKRPVLSPRGMLSEYTRGANHTFSKRIIQSLVGKPFLSKVKFHATSLAEKEEILRIYPKAAVAVIFNFVALPDYKGRSVASRESSQRENMLFLSRITPKKGLELFFTSLKAIEWNFHLTIVGPYDPDYRTSLMDLSRSDGLENKITWAEPVYGDQKYDLLAANDLLVLPSYNENFANVIIEALAFGCPVLISDMVGLAPYIAEKNLGWVTKVDAEDITQKLNEQHEDVDRKEWIRKNAPQIIQEDFKGENLVNSFIALYRSGRDDTSGQRDSDKNEI